MHNDLVQWARIRHRVADGESIRGVSRAAGICCNTVRKMLRRDQPSRYVRLRQSTLVSHYERSIDAILAKDETRPQCERRSVTTIFRYLRDQHAMSRTFSTNSVSVDSLKVSVRCGCRPRARQMRWIVDGA